MDHIQYISVEGKDGHLANIRKALESGCTWIQLRVKESTEEEVLSLAKKARSLCHSYNARLIINDYPQIVEASGADGVHLGKEDMDPLEARKLLGQNKIIGGTANTLEDLLKLGEAGVDYIGLGPFRFTATKKKLSPVLGLEGYQQLLPPFKEEYPHIPVFAIGGITADDLPGILATGIDGIALSSAITESSEPKEIVNRMLENFNYAQK